MIGRFLGPAPKQQGLTISPMRRLGRRAIARFSMLPGQHAFLPPIDRVLSRYKLKRDAREYVIWIDSKAVGYFQLNFDPRETVHYASGDDVCGLEAMCIDSSFQGKGIAVAALGKLGDVLARYHPHIRRINLTVAVENSRARGVYARAGFKQTGKVLNVRNEPDQIVMTRFAQPRSKNLDSDLLPADALLVSSRPDVEKKQRLRKLDRKSKVKLDVKSDGVNHEAA